MEYVTSRDGTRIAFERGGAGTPLVLVHGALCDHEIWAQVVEGFQKQFTVYALDRRGHGESGLFGAGYRMEREYEDVAAVLDAIDGPAYLLGHSSGARYALHACLLAPNVSRLILYEPPALGMSAERAECLMRRFTACAAAGDRDGIVATFLTQMAGYPPEVLPHLREAPVWPMWLRNANTIVREAAAFEDYRFEPERFRSLGVPTLFLLGSGSPRWLKDQTTELSTVLPDSYVQVMPGQGHGAMNGAPALFVRMVTGFLS